MMIDSIEAKIALDSPRYQQLLRHLQLDDQAVELKQFSDCQYHNYRQNGVSFCFDHNPDTLSFHLGAIHIYNTLNDYKFMAVRSDFPLPHGITTEMSLKSITQRFAPTEPNQGGGGRTARIWTKYSDIGLMFEYATKSWDQDAPWVEMTLFSDGDDDE